MGKNGKKILILLSVVLSLLFLSLVGLSIYEYVRIKPNNVHFTNVTSNSVTVSWNTEKEVVGTVKVYEGDSMLPISVLGMNKRFFDTRDVKEAELLAVEKTSENIMANEELTLSVDNFDTEVVVDNMGEYYTHHVTVVGLDPEVEYSFMVGDEYLFRKVKDNNESVLVKTLPVVEEIKSPLPAYGSVKDAENETELPVDELAIISDGIVYFNYYEETTEARSSVFSSTLSDSGAWYVDVATATDQSGKPFFDTYSSVEHEFKIELTLDAGPFGVWKIREINGSNSPTPPIIINFPSPLEDEDIEGSVIKISSVLDPFVQGVSARDIIKNPPKEQEPVQPHCDEGNVLFIGYCGGCRVKCDDGLYRDRSCPQKTLCARGCIDCDDSKTPPAENPIKCGGHDLGTVTKYGSSCLICSKRPSNGYNIGAWEDGNDRYDPNNNCNPKCKPQSCAVLSESLYPFSACPGASNTCSSQIYKDCGGEITCYKRIIPTAPEGEEGGSTCIPKSCTELSADSDDKYYFGECKKANDSFTCTSHRFPDDGCGNPKTCFSIKNEDPSSPESVSPQLEPHQCSDSNIGARCRPYLIWEINSNHVCTESGKCKKPGGSCSTEEGLGTWGNDGYCEIYTADQLCSITDSRDKLYRVNGDRVEKCNRRKNLWEESKMKINCEIKAYCPSTGAYCISEQSETLKCVITKLGEYRWSKDLTEENIGEIIAVSLDQIPGGQKCTGDKCLCVSGSDKNDEIGEDSYCRQVTQCHNSGGMGVPPLNINEGEVCSTDGKTCQNGKCEGRVPDSAQNDSNTLARKAVLSAYASSNEYILDPETGMFTEIPIGSYLFEYEGNTYGFTISPYNPNSRADEISIYIDQNDNGKYDEGTDIKVSDIASKINIITLQTKFDYSLKEGLNFVSFPFLVAGEEFRTAAALLQRLNEVYNNSLYSISKFDGGQWKIVGENVQLYDNNDFQLLPGVGYMIKAKRDINISILGQPVQFESESDTAPIYFSQGWNLISLYGTKVKSYTAKSLIEGINADNFKADNVTKWAKDKQMYEGFQLENKEEYGFDYPLNKLESYFVRITQGKGNWQPSLSGNN